MEEEDVLKLLIDDGDELNDFDIDDDIEEELLRDDPHPRFERTINSNNKNIPNRTTARCDVKAPPIDKDIDDAIGQKRQDGDPVSSSHDNNQVPVGSNESQKRKELPDVVNNSNNKVVSNQNNNSSSSSLNKNKKRKFDKNKNTRIRNNNNNNNNRRIPERVTFNNAYNNNNNGQMPAKKPLLHFPQPNLFNPNHNLTIPVINSNSMNFMNYPNSIPNNYDMQMSGPPLMPNPPLLMSDFNVPQNFNPLFNTNIQSQPLLPGFPQNQFGYEPVNDETLFHNSFSNPNQFNSFGTQNANITQNNIQIPMHNSNISQNNIQVPMQNPNNYNSQISHKKTLIPNPNFNKPIQQNFNFRAPMDNVNYNENPNTNLSPNALLPNQFRPNFGNSVNPSPLLPIRNHRPGMNFGINDFSNNFNQNQQQQNFSSRELDYKQNETDLYEPNFLDDQSNDQGSNSYQMSNSNTTMQQQHQNSSYPKLKPIEKPTRPVLLLRPMPPHLIESANNDKKSNNSTKFNANNANAYNKVNNNSPVKLSQVRPTLNNINMVNKQNQLRPTFTVRNPSQSLRPIVNKNSGGIRPNLAKNVYKLQQQPPTTTKPTMNRAEKMKKLQEALERNEKIKKLQESIAKLKDDFGIDDDYLKKMEDQKKMRDKIAEAKANKRKIFAAVCNNVDSVQLASFTSAVPSATTTTTTSATSNIRPATAVVTNAANQPKANLQVKKELQPSKQISVANSLTSATSKSLQIIFDKPLVVEGAQSSEVKIMGLDSNVRESAIRKLCRPHGMVKSIEFSSEPTATTTNNDKSEGRYAIVKFEKIAEAQTFVKQCQNQQIDSCVISITFNV